MWNTYMVIKFFLLDNNKSNFVFTLRQIGKSVKFFE